MTMIKKYEKKPVVVEAIKIKKDNYPEIVEFVGRDLNFWTQPSDIGALWYVALTDDHDDLKCAKENNAVAEVGDYIIKSSKGEFYPCRSDVFEMAYGEIEND